MINLKTVSFKKLINYFIFVLGSELNGRFISNDYIQTLTVIHPKVSTIGSSETTDTEQQAKHLDSIKEHSIKQTEIRLIGDRMKQQAKQLVVNQKKQFIGKHLSENKRLNEIKNQPLNDELVNGEAVKHQQPIQSRMQTHQHRAQLKDAKIMGSDFIDSGLMEESFARAPASKLLFVLRISLMCVHLLVTKSIIFYCYSAITCV